MNFSKKALVNQKARKISAEALARILDHFFSIG